jgi:hypothetical protein
MSISFAPPVWLFCGFIIVLSSFINPQKKSEKSFPKGSYPFIKILENTADKCYSFSRVAKPGKVSLFILGTHSCAPCEVLKMQLNEAMEKGIINPSEVDIYSYMLSKSAADKTEDLNSRLGYRMLKNIDKLTKIWPTTYITSPTTNCYAIVEGNKYEEIMENIKDLLEAKRKYFDAAGLYLGKSIAKDTVYIRKDPLTGANQKSGAKTVTLNDKKLVSLQEQIDSKSDSIELLQKKISFLKAREQTLKEQIKNALSPDEEPNETK